MREVYMQAILLDAIETFGVQNQCVKATEELAELIKEITKFIIGEGNTDHLVEEMADAEIMIEQLKIIFDIKPVDIEIKRVQKLSRLIDTIKEKKNEK